MAQDDLIDPGAGRILGAGTNTLQRSVDTLDNTLKRLITTTGPTRPAGGASPLAASLGSDARFPRAITWQNQHQQTVGFVWGRPQANANAIAAPMQAAPTTRTTTVVPLTPTSAPTPAQLPATAPATAPVIPRFPRAVSWQTHAPNATYTSAPTNPAGGGGGTPPVRTTTVIPPAPPAPPPTTAPAAPPAGGGNGGGGGGSGVYLGKPGDDEGGSTISFNWRNAARNARRVSKKIGSWGEGLVKTATTMDTYSQWAGIANAAPYGAGGNNNDSVNAIRKYMFGGSGHNLSGWAQNVQDAQRAAFTASRNSGYTELTPGTTGSINPAFAGYMGNVKDLALLNPAMNASTAAGLVGTLGSAQGLYSAQMFGYKPLLSPGGKVNRGALGSFTDSVMQRTFQGKKSISSDELKASLGANGSLHANIQAYVQAAGGNADMTNAIEDYITGRNTAARKGLSGSKFDSLLNQFEKGGSAGKAAGNQLKKFGVTNTILQSQKDLSANKSENVSDLDSLGPAVKKANEALGDFYLALNKIINMPGVGGTAGTVAGWGSVFGSSVGSAFGAMAGMRLGGGVLNTAGSLLGMRTVMGRGGRTTTAGAGARAGTRAGAGGAVRTLGGRLPAATTLNGSIARFGLYGAGAAATNAVGGAVEDHVKNPRLKAGVHVLSDMGTGALAGAAIGSVVPVVGTGIGAAVGAIGGALVGAYQAHKERTTENDGRAGGAASSGKKKSGGSSASAGNVVAGKTAAGAISAALSEIGKPYQWGATGPNSFDCSGLMQYAYKQIGVTLPRVSQDQMKVGKEVDRKDVRPGDLMFPDPGHVVMYIGGNKIVEAPHTGADIRTMPVSEYGQYDAIRRIVGSVGSYGSGADQTADKQKSQSGQLGGNSGSAVLADASGSTEEADAITAAMASTRGALLNAPMNSSAANAGDSSDVGEASSGNYNWGPIKGKVTKVPKPPSWVKSAILKGMSAAHVSGSAWARGLVTIAFRESRFNKNAQNNWDSNAAAGTPSEGLFQVIKPTFESNRAKSLPDDPFNPAASAAAAANYIEHRYHGISNVQQADPDKPPKGYAVGAYRIPNDQIAQVHKDEMIIDKPRADTIRQALLKDVPQMKEAAAVPSSSGGAGGGVNITFAAGSLSFQISGAMDSQAAATAADSFAKALEQNARLKKLGAGV